MTSKELLYLKAKSAYYSGNPIMSDDSFDNLEEELRKEGSKVVNIVGSENASHTIQHLSPMLSLDKIQVHNSLKDDKEKIEEFGKYLMKFPKEEIFEAVFKFDGSSANLVYSEGNLISSATRGNKLAGTDIMSKISKIVPTKISILETIEIRGEVMMKKKTFEEKYSDVYENPRNLVAGILGRDDDKGVENINFVAFRIIKHSNGKKQILNYQDSISLLSKEGFEVPSLVDGFNNSTSDLVSTYEFFYSKLGEQEYEMDGMVISVTNSETIESFGETSHHPKWSIAIKFPATRKETRILNIRWNLGITRRFTPVAELEPISLAGTTVSNVTLNNFSMMKKNKVGIGSRISVYKSGEIIPKVDEVFEHSHIHNAPETCPHCNSKIIEDKNGTHLMCSNEHCSGIIPLRLLNALRILGCKTIGTSMVERIVSAGFSNFLNLLDSSKFNEESLIASGQFKKGRELEKMLSEINRIPKIDTKTAILCANFDGVGSSMAEKVSEFYAGNNPDFKGLTKELVSSFTSTQGSFRIQVEEIIEKLKSLNKFEETKKTSSTTDCLLIELTGSPKEFGFKTKEEFLAKLSEKIEVENVSLKEASMLITDDLSSNSSKMKEAKKKGIEILTYEQILNKF